MVDQVMATENLSYRFFTVLLCLYVKSCLKLFTVKIE